MFVTSDAELAATEPILRKKYRRFYDSRLAG